MGSEENKHLSESCLEFALDIFKETCKKETNNVLLSPISIGVALSMVYAGTKTITREELKKALHLESFADDSVVHTAFQSLITSLMKEQMPGLNLYIANRLYVKYGGSFLEDFQNILQKYYRTDIVSVLFNEETRQEVNAWVESKTNNKIKDLIAEDAFDEMTRMVLVNAVYFKGNWKTPFKASRTAPGDFYINPSTKTTVNMMHNKDDYYYALNEEMKCQILGMPYVNENLLMYVILPNEKDGLQQLETSLTAESLQSLIESMRECEVNVTLPRFKIDWSKSLKDILLELGISSLFSKTEADLSGISSEEKLFVSSVVHKSFIEVNEEGTEAAAATAVLFVGYCLRIIPDFIVDHPFFVLIRDKSSGIILFLGKVVNLKFF